MTIRQVAGLARVSPATVSNYFHKPDRLASETRERIRDAIEALGFVPNDAARTLRRGVSPVVGYIAFELTSATTPEIAGAIEERVSGHGMHLLMANDTGSAQREHSYLQLFEQQRVSGIIIAPVSDVEPELHRMRHRGIASVVSSRRATVASQASASIDHRLGGELAVRHLIEQGRRRIGFVASSLDLRQVEERLHGALSVVEAVPGATLEVIPVPERSVVAGIACADVLASRDPSQLPDALFCANDLLAIGIIQQVMADSRLRVPRDVAVVGYDDIEFARSTIVPLTTVRTPHAQMGVAAADLLFDEIARIPAGRTDLDASDRPQVVFAPELVVRESTTA